eukprot:gb/GECG01011146.1/.p1 GENE.gb/GECG01011146.1/~~gb/GECG01011146.1/.p1  ORF type:complete len:347 (+),score=84.12 gb/GECG01011146.1/:1-1041(+)
MLPRTSRMNRDDTEHEGYVDENGLRMDPWDLNKTWGYNEDELTQEQKSVLMEQASKDELDEAKRIMRHVGSGECVQDTMQRLLHGSGPMQGDGGVPEKRQNDDYDNFLEESDEEEETEHTAYTMEARLEQLDRKYELDEFTSDLLHHILHRGNFSGEQKANSFHQHENGTASSSGQTSQPEEHTPVYMQTGDLPAGVRREDSSRDTVVPREKLDAYIPASAQGETADDPAYDADTVEELLRRLQHQTSTPSRLAQQTSAGKEASGNEDVETLFGGMEGDEAPGSLHVNMDLLQKDTGDTTRNDGDEQLSWRDWERDFERSLADDNDFRQLRDTFLDSVKKEKQGDD